jgi:hypothetical protein
MKKPAIIKVNTPTDIAIPFDCNLKRNTPSTSKQIIRIIVSN